MRPIAAALLLALAAAPGLSSARQGPAARPRFRSDWRAALAEAQARELPIFVEVWVPW